MAGCECAYSVIIIFLFPKKMSDPCIRRHQCKTKQTHTHTHTERKQRRYHAFQYCQVALKANKALVRYQALFCRD